MYFTGERKHSKLYIYVATETLHRGLLRKSEIIRSDYQLTSVKSWNPLLFSERNDGNVMEGMWK